MKSSIANEARKKENGEDLSHDNNGNYEIDSDSSSKNEDEDFSNK